MDDFEKLGAFYLGRVIDSSHREGDAPLLLYDSKDLTTHAVAIGMTGSGKTGLGIGLIEEAALDRVPVIAIDPKGDLGNLLLTFPDLSAEAFRPWVNIQDAASQGKSADAFAAAQAELWREGLAQWGQSGDRIKALRSAADFAIYTPGSSAGRPVSVLRSFAPPPPALRDDRDLYTDRIQSTATSLLALLGIEGDPITSREHILIANILEHAWSTGQALDIAALIRAIQKPPMTRVGVLDIESFFPARERFQLAMQLNNLLAAPGFEAWMRGEPLAIDRLLHTEGGRPRVSVMSIAHLSDAERMFFVCMLLSELLGWMRTQSGTGSLRAVLYMDEIFGYMPPTASPPSKPLLLTLLKQARAFGLGLVLATQNPVDLGYKGLSNAGTWFLGRLQTERDKARVMEGLEGAASGGQFDRDSMGKILAGLGKRRFLLHNVHDNAPVLFETRWTLSYLAGPLSRDQIKRLTEAQAPPGARAREATTAPVPAPVAVVSGPPPIPPDVSQYFLPLATGAASGVIYQPRVIAAADVTFTSARYRVNEARRLLYMAEVAEGPVPLDWNTASTVDVDVADLGTSAADGADFAKCPAAALRAASYRKWEKLFGRWLHTHQAISLFRSPTFKTVSRVGETERAFRARLQQLARERRDAESERLRDKYAERNARLTERLQSAEQALAREEAKSRQTTIETGISIGTALLGAFLGRKSSSRTTASRVGSALKKAGRMGRGSADVERAQAEAASLREELSALEAEFNQDVAKLDTAFSAEAETLEPIPIRPRKGDIQVRFTSLAWAPFSHATDGTPRAAWPNAPVVGEKAGETP